MDSKEKVLSNIIGLNPTGILQFTGTYEMTGNNNIIQTSSTAANESLKTSNQNKIVCNNIEKFENMGENNSMLNKNLMIGLFLILILIFIYLFL